MSIYRDMKPPSISAVKTYYVSLPPKSLLNANYEPAIINNQIYTKKNTTYSFLN